MTARSIITIWCDAPECLQWAGEERDAAAARKVARTHGWVRRGGKDYCEEHTDA